MSIVISDSIVLTEDEEADGINANNPRVGYHNIITASNISSDEADPDFPLVNLTTPTTYQRWKGETDAEQAITVALDEAEAVNYFAIAAHNLGSTAATIVLQSSSDGEDWTDVSTERTLGNDYSFIEEFEDATAAYFRLLITPAESAAPPTIAVLYIGRVLRMQRRIYVGHNPITLNRETEVSSSYSESGQFLGRIKRRQSVRTTAEFKHLTPTWVRNKFEPFMTTAETLPFFFAWRPGEYPEEVAFVELTGDVQPTNQLPNGYMSLQMSMKGIR